MADLPPIDITIYAICNTATGEAYIGQTSMFVKRWQDHRRDLQRGRHHNRALQRAWQCDGEGAFTLVVLERRVCLEYPKAVQSLIPLWQERHWQNRARAAGIALYNDQGAKIAA